MIYSIGLTGGVGSGKTQVAQAFEQHQITVIDTDVIAKQLLQPHTVNHHRVIEHVGIKRLGITEGNPLDRQRLRHLVFTDPALKSWLESLLHPQILDAVQQQRRSATGPYMVVVVPLLVECGWQNHFDRIMVVDCSEKTQLRRLEQRDQLPLRLAKAMLAQQATRTQRQQAADDILINESDHAALIDQVNRWHQRYLHWSQSSN